MKWLLAWTCVVWWLRSHSASVLVFKARRFRSNNLTTSCIIFRFHSSTNLSVKCLMNWNQSMNLYWRNSDAKCPWTWFEKEFIVRCDIIGMWDLMACESRLEQCSMVTQRTFRVKRWYLTMASKERFSRFQFMCKCHWTLFSVNVSLHFNCSWRKSMFVSCVYFKSLLPAITRAVPSQRCHFVREC